MASAKSNTNHYIRLPTIRKIFRNSGQFVCGLCRRNYDDYGEATECLKTCWDQVCISYPLVPRVSGLGRILFRCRFCSRDYKTEKSGMRCAELCRSHRNNKHLKELNLPEKPLLNLPRRDFKSGVTKLKVNYVSKINFKKPEGGNGSEGDSEPVDQNESVQDSHDIKPPPREVVKRNKADFKKQFIRKGAKYCCQYCMIEYYTKMEVQQCFDGHFDEEGNEKDPS